MEVRHGSTRTVLLTDRYAFKFPSCKSWRLFLNGLLANMQEVTFSRTGWDKLCPVCFSIRGGFLVVMRRARPLPRGTYLDLDFDAWVQVGGGVVPVEQKLDSFGILDGRIVAVDYGS